MDVLEALLTRRSARAFLPDAVPEATVERILAVASRAPSGTNTQPWRVYVVTGAARADLCRRVLACREADPGRELPDRPFGEYMYYPYPVPEPYLARRRKLGWDMYQALGVARGDRRASRVAAGRNFEFFGAPVGLIFTLEKVLEKGSWVDLGIFLQSVMLAAGAHGLDTCAQGAWAQYYDVVRTCLDIPDTEIVVCGMSMGFADRSAPVNGIRSERAPLSQFVRFVRQAGRPVPAACTGHREA